MPLAHLLAVVYDSQHEIIRLIVVDLMTIGCVLNDAICCSIKTIDRITCPVPF